MKEDNMQGNTKYTATENFAADTEHKMYCSGLFCLSVLS